MTLVRNETSRHTATVIFLHGVDETSDMWRSAMEGIKLPYVKYLFPAAPVKPVTFQMGLEMSCWYDTYDLDFNDGPEDEAGIKEASENLSAIISNEEENGIPNTRIIVRGFSQGGALALYTALKNMKPLAGVVGLSSWLPLCQSFSKAPRRNLPIFQAHGDADPIVKYECGKRTSETLEKLTTDFVCKTYHGMEHSYCAQELRDVEDWIRKNLPQLHESDGDHDRTY